MSNRNHNRPTEGLQAWRDENGVTDLDVVRSQDYDVADRDAVTAALCDEVEQLRSATGPVPCPRDGWGRTCPIKISTYGTTSASLGDYDAKRGDAAIETYLGRCSWCGQVYAGIAPGGTYSDEPGFADRVQWVPVPGAVEGGAL